MESSVATNICGRSLHGKQYHTGHGEAHQPWSTSRSWPCIVSKGSLFVVVDQGDHPVQMNIGKSQVTNCRPMAAEVEFADCHSAMVDCVLACKHCGGGTMHSWS